VTLTTLSETGWGSTKQGVLQPVALYLSERTRELREQLRRAATSELPVLLQGEIGTGKNLAALELHRASQRKGPLHVLGCAAIGQSCADAARARRTDDALPESALTQLGRVEDARFGTLFLDEVGELPRGAQTALLAVFERLGADFRLVAATRRELRAMVERGEFREDLWQRLSGITIELPSLRARRDEIAALARHFLAQVEGAREIDPTALALLEAYDWPGNMRELRNVLARASSLATGPCITERDLPDDIRAASQSPGAVSAAEHAASLRAHLKAVERAELLRALDRTQGNQRKAALLLGIPLRTFERHLRALREYQRAR
jgi:DNA-binding NtrC family response regulator